MEQAWEKITGKVMGWSNEFISMLPNMAVSILLFILFYLLAKAGKKVFVRLFRKTSNNKAIEHLFSSIVYSTILGIGLFIILGILKLDRAVTSFLAGLGVLGLALGFAFQDIAANFISGIILAFKKPFEVEDIVEVDGIMGRVSRINLRVTVIETFQGQEVYTPNKEVLQNKIINYSILGKRRIDLEVGVSYGDDLEKVEKIVTETIQNLDHVILPENMIFSYTAFDSSSINFKVRFWVAFPGDVSFLVMQGNAIKAIKTAFDQHDITIPFPIRTLDFGIKGGKTLADMQIRNSKI